MSTTTESGPQYVTPQYVALPDIAEALGIIVTRVHQLVRDRQLIAVRIDGALRIPAEFVQDGLVVKGLSGLLVMLHDHKFDDRECIAWLFTDDDLPGRPIDALRENRGSEVKRRAQVLEY